MKYNWNPKQETWIISQIVNIKLLKEDFIFEAVIIRDEDLFEFKNLHILLEDQSYTEDFAPFGKYLIYEIKEEFLKNIETAILTMVNIKWEELHPGEPIKNYDKIVSHTTSPLKFKLEQIWTIDEISEDVKIISYLDILPIRLGRVKFSKPIVEFKGEEIIYYDKVWEESSRNFLEFNKGYNSYLNLINEVIGNILVVNGRKNDE